MSTGTAFSQPYPPRTLLLGLSPIGIGTPDAESLTSLIGRLAPRNGLTVGQLFWGKEMRRYESSHPDMAVLRGIGSESLAKGAVATSATGLKFAEALARLTGYEAVRQLNWGASTVGISHARLHRCHQAWCCRCLAEFPKPYFPMLWDLAIVPACRRCGSLLSHACPKCGVAQRRYRCAGSPLCCRRCDHPLSEGEYRPAAPQEIRAAEEIGCVIAEATAGRLQMSASGMKAALFGCANHHGATSVKKKARLLGMPQSLVCYWNYTDRQPSLQRLFELGLRNGLPLIDLCRGRLDPSIHPLAPRKIRRAWTSRTITPEHRQRLLEHLREVASRDHPPCVQHVARALGVAAGTLKSLSPDLCAEIRRRSTIQNKVTRSVRSLWFQQKVKLCVAGKVAAGESPTMRHVAGYFEKPGVLRFPEYHRFARAEIARARVILRGIEMTQLE